MLKSYLTCILFTPAQNRFPGLVRVHYEAIGSHLSIFLPHQLMRPTASQSCPFENARCSWCKVANLLRYALELGSHLPEPLSKSSSKPEPSIWVSSYPICLPRLSMPTSESRWADGTSTSSPRPWASLLVSMVSCLPSRTSRKVLSYRMLLLRRLTSQ